MSGIIDETCRCYSRGIIKSIIIQYYYYFAQVVPLYLFIYVTAQIPNNNYNYWYLYVAAYSNIYDYKARILYV